MSEGTAFASINFNDPLSSEIFRKRETEVCSKWKETDEDLANCKIKLLQNMAGSFVVKGQAEGAVFLRTSGDSYLKYWAANPPTFGDSYAGSGLPYPNEVVAYENSPNVGVVKCNGGAFEFRLVYPNSYYKDMGTVYVPPQVKFHFVDSEGNKISKIYTVKLGEGIPFRTLTWPRQRNNGPLYYCNNNLPVRTQAEILCQTAYPAVNREPSNFWGLKPPK
jgi:hypothetical protein